jgi:hypothetical protein
MTMASDPLEFLMQRYGASDWLEPERRSENVFVWKLSPVAALEGMQPLRIQSVEIPPEATQASSLARALVEHQTSPMRMTDSIWTPDAGDPRRLVHLRTFECDSRAAARAQLLHVLADMQGPVTERKDVAGEVAFATPGNTTVLGVRGNLVFVLTNGGPEVIDLAETARALDQRLAGEPDAESRSLTPTTIEDTDVSYRAIARDGEVVVENGRPVFRGADVRVVQLPTE